MLSDTERREIQQASAAVQRLAALHLQRARSPQSVIAFIGNLHRGVDQVVQQAQQAGQALACESGCSGCCSARVYASEPEIFQIAATLKTRPSAQFQAVLGRLQTHAALAAHLSTATHRSPCPLLENHLCSVYAVRPAVCRKAHSLDLAACLRPGAAIPQNLNILLQAETLIAGTAAAYQQTGRAVRGHELGQAVLLALNDASLLSRWHAGETVFPTAG